MGSGALSGAAEGSPQQRDLLFCIYTTTLHDPSPRRDLFPLAEGTAKLCTPQKNGTIVCPLKGVYHLPILLTTPPHSHGHVSETRLRLGL